MANAQININTAQAIGLDQMRTEFTEEAQRLVESAATAVRRGPGMLAKAETYRAWATLIDGLLEQVPEEVMDPPPPPDWVADGYAQVPGQRWPHVRSDDGLWHHPDHDEPLTTEQLSEAGAERLEPILAALGLDAHQVEEAPVAEEEPAEEEPAEDDEDGQITHLGDLPQPQADH